MTTTGTTAYDTLVDIVMRTFALITREDAEDAAYGHTRGWDSVGHMALVRRIEDEFDVLLDPEDIIEMSGFARVCAVLGAYGITGLS